MNPVNVMAEIKLITVNSSDVLKHTGALRRTLNSASSVTTPTATALSVSIWLSRLGVKMMWHR